MVRRLGVIVCAVVFFALAASICSAALPVQWNAPRVAVIPFGVQNNSVPDELALEAHKSMCSALAKSKRFSVYDQDALKVWLEKHLPEVKGTLETVSAVKLGEALGCDLVICGTLMTTVVQDGEIQDSFGVHNARMAMVAVEFSVTGVAGASNIIKEIVKGIEVKQVNADVRRFDGDLLKRAAWNSAEDFVSAFYYPSDGKVLVIEVDKFKVGLGKNQGITEKTVFEIYSPGLEIRDPSDGQLVGYEEGENLYARPVKGSINDDTCYAEIGKWKDVTKFLFESSEWRAEPEKLKNIQVGDKVRIRTPFKREDVEEQ